jgi:hypothetical protein
MSYRALTSPQGQTPDLWTDGILEPLAVLPGQHHWAAHYWAFESERRLLVAVLQDAIRCYLVNRDTQSPARRREFCEAQWWFQSQSRRSLFAFENVCDLLGINSDQLRRIVVGACAPRPKASGLLGLSLPHGVGRSVTMSGKRRSVPAKQTA